MRFYQCSNSIVYNFSDTSAIVSVQALGGYPTAKFAVLQWKGGKKNWTPRKKNQEISQQGIGRKKKASITSRQPPATTFAFST
jgi:hypothetical protein